MLGNLSFSQFRAYFRVEEPVRLPRYTGTVLHDALGRAFWQVRYGMKEACPRCPIRSECRYQNLRVYFFKSPADHPFIKPHHDALHRMMKRSEYPQPLVFDAMAGGEYGAGELLLFSFALLGRAIECFPFMACALSLMGGKELRLGGGRISLTAIVNGPPSDDDGESLVYDAGAGRIAGPCQVIDFDGVRRWVAESAGRHAGVRKVRVRFLTPFRYKSNGKLGVPLTFEILVKNLLRRLTLLSVHSPLSCDLDHRHLLARVAEVREVSPTLEWGQRRRHSFSQKEWMSLDGFVGEITFVGDLDSFLPYLKMGEFLRVGKAASFGHGKYQLTILDREDFHA